MRKTLTGDDLLTALQKAGPLNDSETAEFLRRFPLELLRSAADLCGIDATDLTRSQCARAIRENF